MFSRVLSDESRKENNFNIAVERSRYDNHPYTLPKYSCDPCAVFSFFSRQRVFGKPVKVGKEYKNAFFADLTSINYFHTYVIGLLMLGSIGKQLDCKEKKRFKTYVDIDGLYLIEDGEKKRITNGDFRYVVSPKGGLYIFINMNGGSYHNSMRASQPVQCAGCIRIQNGKIESIDNRSGHYCPTKENFLRTLGGLYAAGFIYPETRI
ncbi:MAG: hypothetical protein WC627_02745, partial [Legionella sp.]